jgi:hypothetical protein
MTVPPDSSRAGLWIGVAAAVVLLIGGVAVVMVRSANQRVDTVAREAATRASKLAASQAAATKAAAEDEPSPVFLSVISEPLEAEVTATWKEGGEKKGQAPLSFEVPRNSKVHFEFNKAGYISYAMDVIADQAQNVHAVLHPAPVVAESASEKKQRHKKAPEEKKELAPASKDGVIDIDDALK